MFSSDAHDGDSPGSSPESPSTFGSLNATCIHPRGSIPVVKTLIIRTLTLTSGTNDTMINIPSGSVRVNSSRVNMTPFVYSTQNGSKVVGAELGDSDGVLLGDALGVELGIALGEALGVADGDADGVDEGVELGVALGDAVGPPVGEALGDDEGVDEGVVEGEVEGLALGEADGLELGEALGEALGRALGVDDGDPDACDSVSKSQRPPVPAHPTMKL